MAVRSGGNVEGSIQDEYVTKEGVTIIGLSNLPGEVATDASQVFGNNLYNLIEEYWNEETKSFSFNLSDEILSSCVVTHNGEIVNQILREGE